MLIDFFLRLKGAKIPVSIKEFMVMLEALQKQLSFGSAEEFYYLARLCLVKDETNFDKFDRVFARYFQGVEELGQEITAQIPEQWLRRLAERTLNEEEKSQIEALGGFEKLMETLKKRLEEQKERHQGGGKWIGTAGTSPFGAYGFNPEGIRIGQEGLRHRRAVKVWDQREFKDLDDTVELGTRNIKLALRRLRNFAREGAPEELDLPDTIRSTASNAGYLDIKMVPKRHNKAKLLLFLDVGGSMDPHVQICEQLFSAARSEFKHLEHFYFHNFIYDHVWRSNERRKSDRIPLWDLIHNYGPDYKLFFVGDATMGPYEIDRVGGSVEHYNQEAGAAWIGRLLDHFRRSVWLNPVHQSQWSHTASLQLTQRIMGGNMFPVTVSGLDQAIKVLSS